MTRFSKYQTTQLMASLQEESLCLVESDGEDSCISFKGLINGQDCADCRRSPPPQDLFEFTFHGGESAPEMCAADEIFVHGRMLARNPALPGPAPTPPLRRSRSHAASIGRRRWEAMDGLDPRLRRASSDSAPAGRVPRPRPRPRWYWFLFGSVSIPEPTMEMSEIRSRLRRRAAAPEMRDAGRWAPWKLIQSLSCKGVESAAATAPAPIMGHGGIMGI